MGLCFFGKANLVPEIVDRLRRSGTLANARQSGEQAFRVGRRTQEVCCFKQTRQFVCGNQGNIIRSATLNYHDLAVITHLIK
jgi:hypothetical protein